jgi:hypothetical protein
MNLLIKKVKRVGHGFRSFTNYRLRLLLHCGWHGRLTGPRDCQDAHHVSWRRAGYRRRVAMVGSANLDP